MAKMKIPLILVLMAALVPNRAQGTEEAYPRTAPGVLELKTLPAARLLRSESGRDYFEADNGLFMRLFRYIDQNRIPMTAPVEASVKPGVMRFYLDAGSAARPDLAPTGEVAFVSLPERRIAAIGVRGSYSRDNYDEALAELRTWVAARKDVRAAGEPYAVYWNSPFVPFFLKHSEVHLPVEAVAAPAGK